MHSLKAHFLPFIAAFTLLIFSSTSWAQLQTQAQDQSVVDNTVEIGQSVPKTGDYFLEIFFSLVLVLGIIFLSAWMLRRYGRFPGVADGNLRVLGTLSVGQRERIMLLQVGEQQILVGVTSSRISKLHQLEIPVDIPEPTSIGLGKMAFGAKQKKTEESSSFAQKLQEALQTTQNSETSDEVLTNIPAGKKSNLDSQEVGVAKDSSNETNKKERK
ncbi:flagellar biosynthetic protein FliO [Thiomicrorhabdus indica]|uniref:flagellar biosynthetic protein FliO n=1 Tax=Thiomicrorhabdus indica TaxID=2267253 RepID=UPI002AA6C657|nr:flagellar biosynthetic protein FliO [Thiomicrorhabdus indica]